MHPPVHTMTIQLQTASTDATTNTAPSPPISPNYPGAGILLTRWPQQVPSTGLQFLLLKGVDTGIWSFPKGHPEPIDRQKPLRTAIRETYEETGCMHGRDYWILGHHAVYGKRPYWVGLVCSNRGIRLRPDEHQEAQWMTLQESYAIRSQCNMDVRDWVRKSMGVGATAGGVAAAATKLTPLADPSCCPTR